MFKKEICIICSVIFFLFICNISVCAVDYVGEYSSYLQEFKIYQAQFKTMNTVFTSCQNTISPGDITATCFNSVVLIYDSSLPTLDSNLITLKSNVDSLKEDYISSGGNPSDDLYNQIASLNAEISQMRETLVDFSLELLFFINTETLIHYENVVVDYTINFNTLNLSLYSGINLHSETAVSNAISKLQNLLEDVQGVKGDINELCAQNSLEQCGSVKQSLTDLLNNIDDSIDEGNSYLDSLNKKEQNNSNQNNQSNGNYTNSTNSTTGQNQSNINQPKGFKFVNNNPVISGGIYNVSNTSSKPNIANQSSLQLFSFDLKNLDSNKTDLKNESNINTVNVEPLSIIGFFVITILILIGMTWYFRFRAKLNQ